MLTIEEIQAMSPEELAETNRKLSNALARRLMTRIAVAVVAVVAVELIGRRLDAKTSTETE